MTSSTMNPARTAWGWGLATVHYGREIHDTWLPHPALGAPE
ncbi:MAG: 2,3,4,5-tetrahydropyridine-2,6-dicarboxylate N-succinyltransferase, partial [Acidipropionibacterium jensenii]|nr:2,3,4,5-tetrahydropyridine-2,6-dicarboxylate N-succinyltransferase [Acidipropionibacterium jensenii]